MSILSSTSSGIYSMPVTEQIIIEHGFVLSDTVQTDGPDYWMGYKYTKSTLPIRVYATRRNNYYGKYEQQFFFSVNSIKDKNIYKRVSDNEIKVRKYFRTIGELNDLIKLYYQI